jgi:chromate transport protein ChrA
MGLFEFVVFVMNMLATSQYQSILSSITNIAPGASANQIAVFTSNLIIGSYRHDVLK